MRIVKFLFVFLTAVAWVYGGWPQISGFPPEIQKAQAAISFIGASNLIATNGGAPGAITPHASTQDGDLLVFYHYSRATGGNETVSLSSFTTVFNSVTANNGLVAVMYRIKQAGDSTFTATITNHTSGNSGETVLEWIETYRGFDSSNPIVNYTASLSTWASSLNLGPISAPATATVHDGDMVIVFGGRFENITGQTTLSGDNLAWTSQTLNNSTLGSDAAAVTQNGLNSSGSNQTVTAKTITTTGTTQAGAGRMFIIEKTPPTTTLGDGTNPGNVTIGPGGAATEADSFTLQTSAGTDVITSVATTLATNTTSSIAEVAITSDNGTTVYGSSTNPTADSFTITLNQNTLTANTTQTQYKIRITPKGHAAMPAPPGASYTVTSTITAWSGTNTQAGSDGTSATLTIDNLSPGNVASASGSAGDTQVSLSWTNPSDSDFATTTVLRATSAIGNTAPTEGTSYATSSTVNATTTVACAVGGGAGNSVACTDTGLTNGTAYHYKIFTQDSRGNYDTGTVPSGSPFTPFSATVSCSTNISSTAFGTLALGSINTSSPNASTTVSCTYAAGCTLNVSDAGNGSSPGLATTSPAYLIPSNTTTLSAGTEGYGIQAATTATGSGATLGLNSTYNKSGNDVGGLSLSTTVLASSTATFTNREVVVTHRAAISNLTNAANYADTITYSCVGN